MYYKLLITSLLLWSCSASKGPDAPPEDFSIDSIQGNYRIIPALEQEHLEFTDGKAVWKKAGGDTALDLRADSLGVKLERSGRLVGYFAFAEKKAKSWKGIWNDNLVELQLRQ